MGLAGCRRKRWTWPRHILYRRGEESVGPRVGGHGLYVVLAAGSLLCVNAIAVLHEERFLKNSESGRWAGLRGGGGAGDRGPE